ncbi:MAG: DHH family phosphoesterase [Gammaproteobacteria bacterium]|nr:DHH family phosphoesterase [Gammaproteobacteria bacterium]
MTKQLMATAPVVDAGHTVSIAKRGQQALPTPVVRQREINSEVLATLLEQQVDPWIGHFLARRLDQPMDLSALLNPSLTLVADPSGIPDMDMAVDRIVKAVRTGERIVFACDHDMDGTGSAAVLWCAFAEYFGVSRDRLHVVTSHRLTEGYGITEPVVRRIIELRPSLVITADKGSSDEQRIALLAAANIDVIVTDHHQIPAEGPPRSAYAVLNPTRSESRYDPHVCGAGVAFLTMAKVRTALLNTGWCSEIPSLTGLLDLVAVATIADCVTLLPTRSYTNRVFVKKGLELLNLKRRPCWAVFAEEVKGRVEADDVAFRLAPAIAAAGRLDWAESGFKFLIADTLQEAQQHWRTLQQENAERKQIQKVLQQQAFEIATTMTGSSVVVYLEQGHSGVHGITASRLVETFGKPAAIFSPKGAGARMLLQPTGVGCEVASSDLASGSFRGIAGFDVRRAIERVVNLNPGLVISFGGHPAAAGAVVPIANVGRFAAAYEQAVIEQLGSQPLGPVVWADGELPCGNHTLESLDALSAFGPFGRGFERPLYQGHFRITERTALTGGAHLRLGLIQGNVALKAIWFGAGDVREAAEMQIGDEIFLVYHLADNNFGGRRSVQVMIKHGNRISSR